MARVALVTGGTRGIGAAISVALQQAGRLVIASFAGNTAAAEAFSKEKSWSTMPALPAMPWSPR
jgi:acetoacetyl-CoA reductase